MKLQNVKNEKSVLEFFVEMDTKEWQACQDSSTKKLGRNLKIDGYRPGKAPIELLKKHINQGQVLTDAANSAIEKMLEWLVDSKEFVDNIENLFDNTPETSIETMDFLTIVAKFSFALWPKVSIDYKNIKLETVFEKVTQKDVDNKIEEILSKNEMVVPKEGAIAKDDIAIINFKGFVDDKPFAGGEAKNYELKIGSKSFIDTFEEQLIGLKAGDKKDVLVTFPKDYHAKDLAGKKAKFEVEVNVVNTVEKPKLDDDFVVSLSIKDVKNVDELKKHLTKELETSNEQNYKAKKEQELFEKMLKDGKIEPSIPKYLIDRIYNTRLRYFFNQFQVKNLEEFENVISSFGMKYIDFEANQREEIRKSFQISTYLRQIAILEKLEITKEDIQEKAKVFAQQWNVSVEEIIDDKLLNKAVHNEISKEKALNFVNKLYLEDK